MTDQYERQPEYGEGLRLHLIGQLQTKLTEQALLGSISVDQWVTQLTQQADAAIKKAA